MLLDFISEFIIQLIAAVIISVISVKHFGIRYKFIALMILIPLFTAVLLLITNIDFSSNKFESKIWKSNIHARENMAKSIIKNRILIGKNKKEIIDMLGKNFEKDNVNNDTIFYVVSGKYFPSYLYIKFKNDKVVKVGIMTD